MAIKPSIYVALGFFTFTCGCSTDEPKSDAEKLNAVVVQDNTEAFVSNTLLDKMINSIPSPIELSTLIKESGAGYSANLLNPAINEDKYKDDRSKALNLGVYGLDLGYMNLYDQTLSTVEYVSAINSLSNDLSVGQFFDLNLLKKLSLSNNAEELLQISTNSFRKMNSFLIDQKRGDISLLVLLGSWIEGVYLTSQIASQNNNKDLKERIGEQKKAVDNILILLSIFKNDPKFKELIQSVEELKKLYEGVTITFIYVAATITEIDGEIEVEDNSRNEISISDQRFNQITEKIKQIRNDIIK